MLFYSDKLSFIMVFYQWFHSAYTIKYQVFSIRLFKMTKFFIVLFLFILTQAKNYFNLNTRQTTTLLVGDSLISTLGHFKATLLKQNCALSISTFDIDNIEYVKKGNFIPNNFNKTCKHIKIIDGKVQTDTGDMYIEVKSISHNQSTILTIDDQGIIRLISTYIDPNRVDIISQETVFQNFKIQQKYILSLSNIIVDFGDRYNAVANKRGWKFIAEFGQLTIYYGQNPGIQTNYVYSSITLRDSRIYDFSNKTFPGMLFNNITYSPRCFEPRKYLGFKPPYVFEIDPYWPTVNVYEQGKYKILEVSYSKLPQYDYEQDIREVNYYHQHSPCPKKTFKYLGDCRANCPKPYYHQIRGQNGFCVLTCEQYAQIDQTNRICSCVTDYQMPKLDSKNIHKCPINSSSTPYGCVCSSGYYDSVLTFKCVQNCPSRTYAANGLCMMCPQKCINCSRDNYNRLYLQCTICQDGYKIVGGQCVKQCITYYGYSSVNDICQKCQDPNCVDCSDNPEVCLKCNIQTSLTNGKCNSSCSLPTRQVYSEFFDTHCVSPLVANQGCLVHLSSHYKSTPFLKCDECFFGKMHLDHCVQECPPGYYAHNDKYCTCAGIKNMTINDQCFSLPACPITMSFDIRSHSCISCPFGCMSCINTQCTSCNPGYFLYISPQSILCRRKSPLFPCDNQYSWNRDNVCYVTQYDDFILQMNLCRENIPECQICIPRSNQICVLCNEGFYIYNNTCIQTCPKQMIPYQNTCILTEIKNCSMPHLRSFHRSSIVTIKKIQESQPYKHYIYGGLEPANDPVGYIPYFQQLTQLKSDGIPRQTTFFQPEWVCMKCQDGLGLSDDLKECLPCPHPCQKCYFAKNISCIVKIGQNDKNDDNKTIIIGNQCPYFKDSETGLCLQSCNDPKKYPQIKEGKLYCQGSQNSTTNNYIKIDSSIYPQNDGTFIVIFAFSQKLQEIQMKENRTNNKFTIQMKGLRTQPQRLLQQNSSSIQEELIDDQYILFDGKAAQAYIMNMSQHLKYLKGAQSGSFLPNKVYGIQAQLIEQQLIKNSQKLSQGQTNSVFDYNINSNHRVFIQTWLAYIGYILSIVIILLHAFFIGTQQLYKMDNLLIFCQTIFYFIYSRNLVGRLLSQYYYGFSWSHARFLPNIFNSIIPDHYQQSTPLPYKIVNLDGNYFRNAGYSLGWLLIFIGTWIIITLTVFLLYKLKRAKQIWYPQIARQSLFAGIQFFSMNILYFSYTQLYYSGENINQFTSFYNASQIMAIISITIFSIYTIIRFTINPVGGIYMLKRILIPAIIFSSYQQIVLLVPLIIFQLIFTIIRFITESPQSKKQKLFIIIETVLLIIGYLLLFLCLDAGVNSIIITLLIFAFLVYLAFDLTTAYLQYLQEYPYIQLEKQYQKSKIGEAKMIEQRQTSNKGSTIFKKQSSMFPGPTVF